MPEEQYPPFVTIVGCTKVIYLPAGIKVVYGFSIDDFTNPKVGGYYAVSTTGNSSGEILNLYIFNGNEFFDVGNIYMFFEEFTINGKIRRDKIESLALLDVIITTDDSLDEFLDHYEDYTFQTNDLIAIRVPGGGYQMFLYTGGPEWSETSYLSMGISTITISQVIGLADELDELRRKNVEQDLRLDGLDTSIGTINSAIQLIQLKDIQQDVRLDNLELSVSTINGAIGSINNLLQTHTNQISSLASGLSAEIEARISGDSALQTQINDLVLNKANKDASNLSAPNVISWRDALDIYSKREVEDKLELKLDKPTTDGSWVITKSGSNITYTSASTFGQNIANTNLTWSADRTQNLNAKKLSFTGGRVSVPALELEITAENSVPNKIWTDGVGYYFNNNLGVKKKVALGSVFTYTPTGNFALSTIKTAMENEGLIFNDCNISIILGANNYTCNIDIGSANIGQAITIERLGTGSISFNSSRTLYSGVDAITILNGNEISQVKIKFGTTTDFLIIRNF